MTIKSLFSPIKFTRSIELIRVEIQFCWVRWKYAKTTVWKVEYREKYFIEKKKLIDLIEFHFQVRENIWWQIKSMNFWLLPAELNQKTIFKIEIWIIPHPKFHIRLFPLPFQFIFGKYFRFYIWCFYFFFPEWHYRAMIKLATPNSHKN